MCEAHAIIVEQSPSSLVRTAIVDDCGQGGATFFEVGSPKQQTSV